ncbi:MAG: acyl-CoA thioesterase [Actinobacteria bacterium]|nr:MAG: acyl-CoA thioesterase [Actinomycetota bacterium]
MTDLELGRASNRKPPFKYSSLTRVGFSDTDAQGIVYYGRYLPYFDTALAPASFDDLIEVFIRVSRIGRTSVTYDFAAYKVENDVLMVTANQTLVLVDLDERKACPIPDWYRVAIGDFEGEDLES